MSEPNSFPPGGNFAAQTRTQPNVTATPESGGPPMRPFQEEITPSGGDSISGFIGAGSLGNGAKPYSG